MQQTTVVPPEQTAQAGPLPPFPAGTTETTDGRAWLMAAIDPFHDEEIDLSGLPDDDQTRTVIQLKKQTLNISAPPGTLGNWSCHIFSQPLLYVSAVTPVVKNITQYSNWQQYALAAGGFAQPKIVALRPTEAPPIVYSAMSTMNIHAWSTDQATVYPMGGAYVQPSVNTLSACSNQTYIENVEPTRMRMIGCGFEVINTTAPLYQQGLVTVSRIPSRQRTASLASIYHNVASNVQVLQPVGGPFPTVIAPPVVPIQYAVSGGPPTSVTDALSYSGTLQWEASKGCYCVLTQLAEKNPIMVPVESGVASMTSDTAVGAFDNPTGYASRSAKVEGLVLSSEVIPLQQTTPFEVTSAIFTGLSLQTTLTLNVHYYLEIAPRTFDSSYAQLVYSATPSPMLDKMALDSYQRITAHLPVGVPRHQNASGDFWRMIQGVARALLPTAREAAALLPGSVQKALRMASNGVSAIMAPNPRSQQKQKRKSSKPASRASSRASSVGSNRSQSLRSSKQIKKKVRISQIKSAKH